MQNSKKMIPFTICVFREQIQIRGMLINATKNNTHIYITLCFKKRHPIYFTSFTSAMTLLKQFG